MINEANSLDLDDLDYNEQDYVNDSPESDEDVHEDTPEVDNPSDLDDFDLTKELLALLGISDINKIKFEDESGAVVEKSWDSLTNNEKLMILSHQEDPDTSLDAAEIELINLIRESGMSPDQYIQSLLTTPDRDPVKYEVDSMSDDTLFCLDLLDKLGDDITDEELQQALDAAKANQSLYSKQIAGLRVYYKNLENLKMQQLEQEKLEEAEKQYDTFVNDVVNSIKNLNYLDDTPVELSRDEMEDLANYILTRDSLGHSEFSRLLNDPAQFTKAAFWMLKGPEILNEMQNLIKEAYLRGYNESHKTPISKKVFTKPSNTSPSKNSNKESQYAYFDEDSYLNN